MSAGDPKREPQSAKSAANSADKTTASSAKDAAAKSGVDKKAKGKPVDPKVDEAKAARAKEKEAKAKAKAEKKAEKERRANDPRYKGFKGFIRRMLEFMPLWAWVLCFGLVLALFMVGGAIATMSNLQVGNDSPDGKPSQVRMEYPAATTTGKYDKDTDKPAASQQQYIPDYNYQPQQQWTPPATQAPTNTDNQSTKTSESKPKPSEGSPSSPRPAPSTSNPGPTSNPAPAPTPVNPAPGPGPGNGGGPAPGPGNGGGGNPGNPGGGGGGEAPVEPAPGGPGAALNIPFL